MSLNRVVTKRLQTEGVAPGANTDFGQLLVANTTIGARGTSFHARLLVDITVATGTTLTARETKGGTQRVLHTVALTAATQATFRLPMDAGATSYEFQISGAVTVTKLSLTEEFGEDVVAPV